MGRTSAVEKVQQAAERYALAGQQRAMEDIEAERAAAESQVRETHNKNEHVEEENRRRNSFAGRRRRRDKDGESEEAHVVRNPLPDGVQHNLDISI
jgi:hypothetical protein